jgi:hypothetical protein
MPHTTTSIQVNDEKRTKTFGELQIGDWFQANNHIFIRVALLANATGETNAICVGTASHFFFDTKEPVRPIKQVNISVEWI